MTVEVPLPLYRAQERSFPVEMLIGAYHRAVERKLFPGERRLGWFILPPFQRPPVWTKAQQGRFIESLFLELPVGVYVYVSAIGAQTDTWLIDGQQRVGAVLAFAANEVEAFGFRFDDLSPVQKRRFGNRVFNAIEVAEPDPVVLADIYDRLAYGGTPHEPKGVCATCGDPLYTAPNGNTGCMGCNPPGYGARY